MDKVKFDPTQLCSRKLWELISTENDDQVDERALKEAIEELASRRQNLEKLQQTGVLERSDKNV
jgi:hypothetical protein